MKAKISAFIFLLAFSLSTWAETPVYIDVRTPEEFAQGHIAHALLMPHTEIGELIKTAHIAKDTPITLYCHSGRRAEMARKILLTLGYTHVTNAGGYQALAAKLEQSCQAETC